MTTTSAVVYFNGEFLCSTTHDGYPHHLGESLESTKSDLRSILSTCKDFGIYYINAKFFLIDSKFVFNFLDTHQKKKLLGEYPGTIPVVHEILVGNVST